MNRRPNKDQKRIPNTTALFAMVCPGQLDTEGLGTTPSGGKDLAFCPRPTLQIIAIMAIWRPNLSPQNISAPAAARHRKAHAIKARRAIVGFMRLRLPTT